MTWRNLGAIVTTKDWQYTQPITGNVVRLRHEVEGGTDNAPYGFKGAIAVAYNYIELYQYRSIYPNVEHDVYVFDNPLENVERRIAVRGQRRYKAAPQWRIVIEEWIPQIPTPIQKIITELANVNENVRRIATSLEIDLAKALYTIRINIGGGDYTDTNGNFWLGRQLEQYQGTYRIHDPIDDPNSYLFESSLNAKVAGYVDNNAPSGEYQISVLAQEWYRDDDTTRYIDIRINGVLVEEGLNIWAQAGGQYKPLVKTYTITTTGGLSIEATGQNNKPIIICALEILQIS